MAATIHGNYRGYQGSARTTTGENMSTHIVDERLALVTAAVPDIFSGKWVLDVGCNDGRVAVDIALHYSPAAVTGVDPDPVLIQKAKSHLSFRWSRLGPGGEIDYFPASAVEEVGHVPYPRDETEGFPWNVEFVRGDFLEWTGEGEGESECEGGYGVVVMLSVIKWIHLEGGDDGLKSTFEKVVWLLVEGGYFVFEPQDWDSYGHAVKKNPELKAKKEALRIRPGEFAGMLEELGLEVVQEIGGRKRKLWVWRKR